MKAREIAMDILTNDTLYMWVYEDDMAGAVDHVRRLIDQYDMDGVTVEDVAREMVTIGKEFPREEKAKDIGEMSLMNAEWALKDLKKEAKADDGTSPELKEDYLNLLDELIEIVNKRWEELR